MTTAIANKQRVSKEAIGQDYNLQLHNPKTKILHSNNNGEGPNIHHEMSSNGANYPSVECKIY